MADAGWGNPDPRLWITLEAMSAERRETDCEVCADQIVLCLASK